jgi:hypothetical protein
MEMGERLATEVKQYIISFCPASCLSKISFIGHSLGGIIVKASLPHLAEYSSKFFTYISLSSPHMGQMFGKSSLVDAGLWVLKKWRKSKSLMQLSMTDESTMENTCLYRLSELPGFCWFKNIVFMCSTQDNYVPYDSARVQIGREAQQQAGNNQHYIKMATNLLGDI